jgi:hypothetical protein
VKALGILNAAYVQWTKSSIIEASAAKFHAAHWPMLTKAAIGGFIAILSSG